MSLPPTLARQRALLWGLAVVMIAVAVYWPATSVGFLADDVYQIALNDGVAGPRAPWALYSLYPDDPSATAEHMARGSLPWWTIPHFRFVQLRPLSSLLLALDHALRAGLGADLVLEVDHRADVRRLAPILRHAFHLGYTGACLVVQDERGVMGCQALRLGTPADAEHHLLVQRDTLVYIAGEEPVELDADGLATIEGPVALHLDDALGADRLFAILGHDLPDPVLVAD